VYRMWFVARDAVGVASIAMAQAEVQDPDDIPSFAPYPANPVLTRTSPSMATCANCDLLGLAVSRRPDADATLRFFVARRVNTLPASEGHQLIGLDQFWRSD